METPKRGTETGLNDRRKLVTNCGTVACPGRPLMRKRGIGNENEAKHGAERLA